MQKALQKIIYSNFSWMTNLKGINCGNGWFNIIDLLCSKIHHHLTMHPIKDFRIDYIGEEFGCLNVKINSKDELILKYINEAQESSYGICEICGDPGKLYNKGGWLITICPSCNEGDFEGIHLESAGFIFNNLKL